MYMPNQYVTKYMYFKSYRINTWDMHRILLSLKFRWVILYFFAALCSSCNHTHQTPFPDDWAISQSYNLGKYVKQPNQNKIPEHDMGYIFITRNSEVMRFTPRVFGRTITQKRIVAHTRYFAGTRISVGMSCNHEVIDTSAGQRVGDVLQLL